MKKEKKRVCEFDISDRMAAYNGYSKLPSVPEDGQLDQGIEHIEEVSIQMDT
jgi:hypothetical protein